MKESLRKRLRVSFFGIAVIPLIIAGILLCWQSYTIQKQQAIRYQQETVFRVSLQLGNFINSLEKQLQVTAKLLSSEWEDKKHQDMMLAIQESNTFNELVLLDSDGKEVIRRSRLSVVHQADLKDRSADEFYIQPKQNGQTYYSPVYFHEVSREPLMIISVGVEDIITGLFSGVLLAEIRLKSVWNLFEKSSIKKQDLEIFLLNTKSDIIAHPNSSVVLRGSTWESASQAGIREDMHGRKVLFAKQDIRFGAQKFTIVSQRQLFDAMSLAYKTVYIFVGSIFISLIAATVLVLFAIRKIIHPVNILVKAVKKIQEGDLAPKFEISSDDEIGLLAESFKQMAHSLDTELTERRKSEMEVRRSENRLRRIIDIVPSMIFVKNAEGRFLVANKSVAESLGMTVQELVGRLHSEIHPDLDEVNQMLAADRSAIDSGRTVHIAKESYLDIEGNTRWLQTTKVPCLESDFGEPVIVGLATDITERIKAEEALYFTKFAVDHSTDSAFWSGEDGTFVYVNDAACRSLGYSREELMAMSVSDFDPNFPRDAWTNHWEDLKERGSIAVETLHQTKDGRFFPVEIIATFMEYEGKEFNCSFVRDITERKQVEKKLADEKERLAVTLRSIGDGVITTDISGKVVLLNKISEELTGWSNEEAVGRPLEEVFHIINEKTREICENPVTKIVSSGQIVGLASYTVLVAKDGREWSIADSGAPILDDESNIVGVVIVFRDVTEQIRTEKEILKVKKLESVGVLAGGIAHDFNNILVAILGNINLALLDVNLKEKTKNLLSEAEKASLRAKDLTQQLLTFAKGGEPVTELSSLENIIKESANFVLRGDKVACHYDIPEDLWLVDIDKGQMSQVIQNIVLNASHAMPEGGIIQITCENIDCLHVESVSLPCNKKFVGVTITDSGTGIPANVIDKIFDPYFSSKQEGSGLGLAISHSIITKHKGHIAVESTPSVGTTFTIYIPASIYKQKLEKREEKSIKECKGKAKIMVMDDDAMIRDIAQSMLSLLGHEVVLVQDGVEALALYREHSDASKPIDIVIMDLTIPGGMGGQDAVKEVLAFDPDARIIVSSGYSTDPIMANCQKYGFCAAIVKPYQLQELTKVINQVMA